MAVMLLRHGVSTSSMQIPCTQWQTLSFHHSMEVIGPHNIFSSFDPSVNPSHIDIGAVKLEFRPFKIAVTSDLDASQVNHFMCANVLL